MWTFENPVTVDYGIGVFDKVKEVLGGRSYALVTYPDAPFQDLSRQLIQGAGVPLLIVNDVLANPDVDLLEKQCRRFRPLGKTVEAIVALGGGSVIDSAKVFSVAGGDFGRVASCLVDGKGHKAFAKTPIIAVPTTAGTGSEVTCWATIWNKARGKKYSLELPSLFPERALVDPMLTVENPMCLTVSTALDSLSHALESIWNKNSNPVSLRLSVASAKLILENLPRLLGDLQNIKLRKIQAEASLLAGLAFSNTKTALAHNLSYPITLKWGVPHGVACSFSLPIILRSVQGIGGDREQALADIFGADFEKGALWLMRFLNRIGIGCTFSAQGVPKRSVGPIVDAAFSGPRGQNFVGTKAAFVSSLQIQNDLGPTFG